MKIILLICVTVYSTALYNEAIDKMEILFFLHEVMSKDKRT